MKVKFSIIKEFSKDEILDIVNDYQWENGLEYFDSFEEIPEQLIYYYMDEQFLTDYFFSEMYDNIYEEQVNYEICD